MTPANRDNLRVQVASVTVALVLVAAKLWAFGVTGALSVAASLADSAMDLMVSLGGLAAIRYAQRPPDEDHAFGHSSAEDLSALGQSAFILVSASAIAWAAIARFGSEPALSGEAAGIVVMILSILLTIGLVAVQTRVARRTGNRVVQADRLHYLGDLLPNLGAIAALGASRAFDLTALDSVIALGAAAMLVVGALRIGCGAWNALMDRAAPAHLVESIAALADSTPGVAGHHDLRTRMAGSHVFVNIHLEIDGGLPLRDAHEIGEALRRAVEARHTDIDVIVHHDPV